MIKAKIQLFIRGLFPLFTRKLLAVCVLCLLGSLYAQVGAQDTDFWFVVPRLGELVADGTPLDRPALLASSNATEQTAHVTITRYNGADPSLVNNVTITAGGFYKLDFITEADMRTIVNPRCPAGSVTEYGIHITSDVKVTAYYMVNYVGSKDIFTLKGKQALGTQFYVPMQSDNYHTSYTPQVYAHDQIDIVATENGTTVNVTPKTAIRIGESGSSPAGTTITRSLSQGQTLKIMEHTSNSYPSLAGTYISSNKPIAVTSTEDFIGKDAGWGDVTGDQIVPVNSLGTRYVVPRGYRTAAADERFYVVASESGTTTVNIYANASSSTPSSTITLTSAGAMSFYRPIPSSSNAVYVEASKPIYCYQFTGYGEEGAALLPSIYSIGQRKVSYFQVSAEYEKGFVVFRTGAENSFRISYGSVKQAVFNVGSALNIPKISDWKIARFDLPSAANNQAVTIENTQSPFSFGYVAANTSPGTTGYGYLSAFGDFEFPDTTYMCGTSVTLDGGYAMNYYWTLPDNSHLDTQSINATQEGEYTLVMNQDSRDVTATTYVRKISAGAIGSAQTVCTGTPAAPLTETSPATGAQGYQWQSSPDNVAWTDIGGATLPTYSPGTLTATTYFRRAVINASCGRVNSDAVCITVSPCVAPVNPHLRARVTN
ncbi:MAG: hypothetical protein LBQ73_09480 [Tannerellaceae bacterium]|jgi:hypothetical protein|nr:hypothetical protein [Tannerellaceae bacterium]